MGFIDVDVGQVSDPSFIIEGRPTFHPGQGIACDRRSVLGRQGREIRVAEPSGKVGLEFL